MVVSFKKMSSLKPTGNAIFDARKSSKLLKCSHSSTGLSFCMKIFPRYIETIASYSSCSMLEVFSSTDYLKQFLVYNYPNEQKGVSF